VIARQDATMLAGAIIGPEAFLLRWCDVEEEDDRLLLVNLGPDFSWRPVAEPLIAAPLGKHWKMQWSSDAPRYGGSGSALLNTKQWRAPGHAAILLQASAADVNAP
jgi:maltooligosyltrehalose trehalohydrolase